MTDLVHCTRCLRIKTRDKFPPNKRYKNGLNCWCRECCNAYKRDLRDRDKSKQQAYFRKSTAKIRDYIRAAKDMPCMDCGHRYHYAVMDFDHREGADKKFTLAKFPSSLERVKAEIAKCDVVCANCHRMRTWKRKNASAEKDSIL